MGSGSLRLTNCMHRSWSVPLEQERPQQTGTEPPHWPCSQTVRPPVQRGPENLPSTAGTTRSNKAATGDQYPKTVITARCGWGPRPPGRACAVTRSRGAPATLASPAAITPALGLTAELWLPQGCAAAAEPRCVRTWSPGSLERQGLVLGAAEGMASREQHSRTEAGARGGRPGCAQTGPLGEAGEGLDQGGVAGWHPSPLPAHGTLQATDPLAIDTFSPALSTVLRKLTAPCDGLFWGSLFPTQHPPSLWSPLCVLSQTSSPGNPIHSPFVDLCSPLPIRVDMRARWQGHGA